MITSLSHPKTERPPSEWRDVLPLAHTLVVAIGCNLLELRFIVLIRESRLQRDGPRIIRVCNASIGFRATESAG
jgi:hypothetical protein